MTLYAHCKIMMAIASDITRDLSKFLIIIRTGNRLKPKTNSLHEGVVLVVFVAKIATVRFGGGLGRPLHSYRVKV